MITAKLQNCKNPLQSGCDDKMKTIVLHILAFYYFLLHPFSIPVAANESAAVAGEDEALLASSSSTTTNNNQPLRTTPFRIAGYVPDYRFDGIDLNRTAEYVDDLFLFSIMPQTQLGMHSMLKVCCLSADMYETARQAVAHAKSTAGRKVKLWVTLGGAGRSHKMMVNPSETIGALRELLFAEELKGVDFNCNEFRSHQDYVDYETLIRNTAKVLYKLGAQVSVAIHPGQHLSSEEMYDIVDRVNLMAYDMYGAAYHADYTTATRAVDALIKSGCPPEKIFLGIPAYGRHVRNPKDTKTYAELIDMALESSVEDSSDVQSKMSDYQMETPAAVAKKVKYAYEAGLGGVFFWELGQDKQSKSAPAGILLQAAAAAVPKENFNAGKRSPLEDLVTASKNIDETSGEL